MNNEQIAQWCYTQIKLLNKLISLKDFPGEVEYCGHKYCHKGVHIYCGIEKIADALKLPLKIEADSNVYRKTVEHLGVTFYQIEFYKNASMI